MVDLLSLLTKFDAVDDRESDVAFFRTHVSWVAPEAYLNIVHKPAAPDVLPAVASKMKIPPSWVQFLARNNGATLFSTALYILGVVRTGQSLNRAARFSLPPHNIESENCSWPPPDRDRYLKIASYGFDGSIVCIDRSKLDVSVFHRTERNPYCSWPNAEDWVRSEVARLSELFDRSGRRLVESAKTLPESARLV